MPNESSRDFYHCGAALEVARACGRGEWRWNASFRGLFRSEPSPCLRNELDSFTPVRSYTNSQFLSNINNLRGHLLHRLPRYRKPAIHPLSQLMMALIVTAVMTTSKQYLGMTWSLWLACVSFLFAPFWFNPLSFHWGKVVQDYKIWMRWMNATGGSSSNSWEVGLFCLRRGAGQTVGA